MKTFLLLGLLSFSMSTFALEKVDEKKLQPIVVKNINERISRANDEGCGGGNSCAGSQTPGTTPGDKSFQIAKYAMLSAEESREIQNDAAQRAEDQVKVNVARLAAQASKTAEGATCGKKSVVDQTQNVVKDAKVVLRHEEHEVEVGQGNTNAADQGRIKAMADLDAVNHDEKMAKENLKNWDQVLTFKEQQLDQKIKNRDTSKKRLTELEKRLKVALEDLARTAHAACVAAEAAKRAREKAGSLQVKRHLKIGLDNIDNDRLLLAEICDDSCKTSVGKEHATTMAQNAAAAATAASNAQSSVAHQAAQQVRVQFAEKAEQSAKAAEAVMAEKKRVVEQFHSEVRDAKYLVQQDEQGVRFAQNNVDAARQATIRAKQLADQIYRVVIQTKEDLKAWEQLWHCDKLYLNKKLKDRDASKVRLCLAEKELTLATEDFSRAQLAACRAAASARKAQEMAGCA